MDSEAVGGSEKPEVQKSTIEKILENYQILEIDMGGDSKLEAGDQFFGIAQPMAEDGKLIAPLDAILARENLSADLNKKGKTYGIFEFISRGKMGFVDLKNLPSNISLFDFCRFRFEITAILKDQKIKNIGHLFYARILREELSGVKHTHYRKGTKFLTEVPEKFREMWLPAKKPGTDDVYYILRGNDEIERKRVERGDGFNAILTEYKGSGEHDFEIQQFREFGYIGYVKPEDMNHKLETKFNYKMLRTGLVYRFAAVHVMLPREEGLRKFYCIPLQLVKDRESAYVMYESA
ncbi:MAG: hypothetical protein Q7J54_06830 [Candidatus Woesearchaeota archaeon]|nr:hypothetical protein [Candidatus Woesearchaeota archaeon]